MIRIIGSLLAVTGLLLGASQSAEAHGNAYRGHDSSGYHYGVFYRQQHMPRSLWNKRGFRRWYFRTPHRFNRRLAWRELHDAYRWELRRGNRGHYRAHLDARKYNASRGKRYWRDDHHRKRASKKRHRNRDE